MKIYLTNESYTNNPGFRLINAHCNCHHLIDSYSSCINKQPIYSNKELILMECKYTNQLLKFKTTKGSPKFDKLTNINTLINDTSNLEETLQLIKLKNELHLT